MPRSPGCRRSSGCGRSSVSLLVYAVLGSSRQLSVGPESTTALMTASVVAPLAAGDPARYAALAAALALIVGGLCLLAWAGPAGFPRRPAVQAGAGRLHGGHRGDHDRQPAGEAHRRAGRGRCVAGEVASFVSRLDRDQPADAAARRWRSWSFCWSGAMVAPKAPVPLIGVLLADGGGGRVLACRTRGSRSSARSPAGCPTPTLPARDHRPTWSRSCCPRWA